MHARDVEIWGLRVLSQITSNAPFESAFVELKATWIDPQQAARRIAGHANAARGSPILWLIGVDEKRGVVGASPIKLANWWGQVKAEFDHVTPDVADTVIDWQGKAVFALGFETNLAPYVVKNPQFGQKGSGPVKYEVPWREGTAVDTAKRSQLLLILAPTARLPQFDILEAQLVIVRSTLGGVSKADWNFSAVIYITPRSAERLAIAAHRVAASHQTIGTDDAITYTGEKLMFPMGWRDGGFTPFTQSPALHPTIRGTTFDLTIDGPGLMKVIVMTPVEHVGQLQRTRIGTLKIAPTGSDLAAELVVQLRYNPTLELQERWTVP